MTKRLGVTCKLCWRMYLRRGPTATCCHAPSARLALLEGISEHVSASPAM